MERYKDAPEAQGHIFKETDEKIIHVTFPISAETNLMDSDNSEAYEDSAAHKR